MQLPDHISLSRLSDEIKSVINQAFQGRLYWVTAEVSNLNHYVSKGTWYFDLCEKDPVHSRVTALLRAAAFGQGGTEIEQFEKVTHQKFANGLQVLVQVELNFHEVFGLQLRLRRIDPFYTLGNIERQRQLNLERLIAENPDAVWLEDGRYFTRNQGLSIPAAFSRLAVVSSANSAGLQDFVHALQDNKFGYRFSCDFYYTEVQGPENAPKLVERLVAIFKSKIPYDAVAILRGGGAQSDFLLFDTYEVARAIARFPIPVITGIGHQKNETLADMMARHCTRTPTQAAEFILDTNRSFEQSLLDLMHTISLGSQQRIARNKDSVGRLSRLFTGASVRLLAAEKERLGQLKGGTALSAAAKIQKSRTALQSEKAMLVQLSLNYSKNLSRKLGETGQQLELSSKKLLRFRSGELMHYRSVFDLLDIQKTLARGFALVRDGHGIVTSAENLSMGESINIQLAAMSIQADVTGITKTTNGNTDTGSRLADV